MRTAEENDRTSRRGSKNGKEENLSKNPIRAFKHNQSKSGFTLGPSKGENVSILKMYNSLQVTDDSLAFCPHEARLNQSGELQIQSRK